MARRFTILIVLAATLMLGGCGYNTLQSSDEQIKAIQPLCGQAMFALVPLQEKTEKLQ